MLQFLFLQVNRNFYFSLCWAKKTELKKWATYIWKPRQCHKKHHTAFVSLSSCFSGLHFFSHPSSTMPFQDRPWLWSSRGSHMHGTPGEAGACPEHKTGKAQQRFKLHKTSAVQELRQDQTKQQLPAAPNVNSENE